MLSDELTALAERFDEHATTGVEMSPEGVAHFATMFRCLAEQAEAMEAAEVPHQARILPFPAFRNARPDPGDAA